MFPAGSGRSWFSFVTFHSLRGAALLIILGVASVAHSQGYVDHGASRRYGPYAGSTVTESVEIYDPGYGLYSGYYSPWVPGWGVGGWGYRPGWGWGGYPYRVVPFGFVPYTEIYGPGLRMLTAPTPRRTAREPELIEPQADLPEEDAARQRIRVRRSNHESRARAWRFIRSGDEHFTNGKYSRAASVYAQAAEAAPDISEPHFRRGQAMVANGQYDQAAGPFKRGLLLSESVELAELELSQLYANEPLAQAGHLEALASAADARPESADLWLLVGLQLYFGGDPQRASRFLSEAARRYQFGDEDLSRVVGELATRAVQAGEVPRRDDHPGAVEEPKPAAEAAPDGGPPAGDRVPRKPMRPARDEGPKLRPDPADPEA